MESPKSHSTSPRWSESAIGFAYTTSAFLLWGLAPVYWKALGHVGALELVAHRIVWAAVAMAALLSFRRSWSGVARIFRSRRTTLLMASSTLLIAANWYLFVWAVNSGRVLEASLAYFINPLLNVVLGMVFLGERLRRAQAAAVLLAAAGVVVLTLRMGELPWVSLGMAAAFGFYGLVRKTVDASPENGLALETLLLTPFALAYLGLLEARGEAALGHLGAETDVLLVLAGVITAAPLVWFAHGARRLPLSTVGVLQYLAPTGQFLLAVFVYREPFTLPRLLAFACIWTALAIYTWDGHAHWRRKRRERRKIQGEVF